MAPLLAMRNVSKTFTRGVRATVVLDDVSLELRRGDFVGVLGGRRQGKSTLLEIAVGKQAPDSGRVEFEGVDISGMSKRDRDRMRRSGIGFVSGRTTGPAQTGRVLDHVGLPLLSDGATLRQARRAAAETLARVGAADYTYADVQHLSESEQLRVALAQAYVRSPRLLVVDELTDTLDLEERNTILGVLQRFAQDDDVGVIVTASDPNGTAGCNRVVYLSAGRLRDPDRDLARRPDPPSGDVVPFRRDDDAGSA